MKYKVYNKFSHKEVTDYVGAWYSGQFNPQNIYVEIDGEDEDFEIYCDCNVGGGVSPKLWRGKSIRIQIPAEALSQCEIDDLNEYIKPYADKLVSYYQNNDCFGDCILTKELEQKLWEKAGDFELFFDSEGLYEEEEE